MAQTQSRCLVVKLSCFKFDIQWMMPSSGSYEFHSLTPPHFCAYPKPGSGFLMLYVTFQWIIPSSGSYEFHSLTPPHFCAYPKRGPGFPTLYVVVFFVFNGFRWEGIVRFVDVGRTVENHCLNFTYIISVLKTYKVPSSERLITRASSNLDNIKWS